MTGRRDDNVAEAARPRADDTRHIVRFLIGKALLFMLFPAILAALAVFFLI